MDGQNPILEKKSRLPILIATMAVMVVLAIVVAAVFVIKNTKSDYPDLFSVETAYAEGKISYSEALDEVEVFRKSKKTVPDDVEKSISYIKAIKECKDAYTSAIRLAESKSYGAAIAELKKVRYVEDSNYEAAKALLSDCTDSYVKETVRKMDLLVAQEKVSEARAILDEAIALLPEEEVFAEKRQQYNDLERKSTDEDPVEEHTTEREEPTTEREDPTTKPDSKPVSDNPVIVSALTVTGDVLPSSNVSGTRSFDADQAVDGDPESCWCVSCNEGGAGAQIRFNLDGKSAVRGIKLINGNLFQPEDDIYKSNGQIKHFTLTFSNGSTKSFTASYNSDADKGYETFTFDKPIETSYIILTVDSAYVGAKYTSNVCLGEFAVK